MANKKKTVIPSPTQQLLAYAVPKEDKCTLSLPISETENINIEVKPLLSADEMASFVDGVTEALFLNDQYSPALHKLIYTKAILAYYTNLKTSISNTDLVSLVFESNLIERIEEKINEVQKDTLINAVNKNIEFKKQRILNTQSARLEESIRQIELLTDATSKMMEQYNGIDMKQIADATVKLSNISERDIVDNILDIRFGEKPVVALETDNHGDENV